jgi:hypothetical protein
LNRRIAQREALAGVSRATATTGIFGKEAADALIDQEYYRSFEAAILRRDEMRV